jgi:hypothetical protein
MAQYWTPYALGPLATSESGGNPTLCNATGHCGLYQFARDTWQQYAPQAGINIGLYPTADTAPAELQTAVALVTPITNWTCPGCNTYANQLASLAGTTTAYPATGTGLTFADPLTAAQGGDYGGGSDTPGLSSNPVPANPGLPYCGNPGVTWWQRLTGGCDPNTSNPGSTGPVSAAASGLTGLFTSLSDPNTWTRVGIILVGLVILLAALFLFGFSSYARAAESRA